MHLIIYVSDYTGSKDEIARNLHDICAVSKTNNPRRDITGVLFYHNGNFLQVIESKKAELEQLMSVLEKDERHKNITRIVDMRVQMRSFPDWNMDTFDLDSNERIDRQTIAEYREYYSTQCEMEASQFIRFLKDLCADPKLISVTQG